MSKKNNHLKRNYKQSNPYRRKRGKSRYFVMFTKKKRRVYKRKRGFVFSKWMLMAGLSLAALLVPAYLSVKALIQYKKEGACAPVAK